MLIGYQKQWNFLKKIAESENVPHSFLFYGEPNLGKKKIAIEFVKLLNCEGVSKIKKPCQECSSCKKIEKFIHPDVLVIEPENKEIKILQIRKIKDKLSLSSLRKAIILNKAHLMNKYAQAALLKTLEEPKGNVILILLADRLDSLSETILSRVQKIKFNKINRKNIQEYLVKEGISHEKARTISFLSKGKPGIVFDLVADKEKIKDKCLKIDEFIENIVLSSNLSDKFKYAKNNSAESSEELNELLNDWLKYFHECFLLKIGVLSDIDSYYKFQDLSKKYSLLKIKNIIEVIEKIKLSLSSTKINSKLALEIIMLEL